MGDRGGRAHQVSRESEARIRPRAGMAWAASFTGPYVRRPDTRSDFLNGTRLMRACVQDNLSL
jgi:hypothetical protein